MGVSTGSPPSMPMGAADVNGQPLEKWEQKALAAGWTPPKTDPRFKVKKS